MHLKKLTENPNRALLVGNSILVERIDALIRVFLYILIFWLPYSPAVIETCVIICIMLWFVKRCILLSSTKDSSGTLKGKFICILKAFKPESTFLNIPIGLFLFACILSVTSSAFFTQSFHNFLSKTLEWFIIYFLIVEVFNNKRHIIIALGIFLFTAFSTVLDSLYQFYISGEDIFLSHNIVLGSRATAGFKTANGLGGYLTIFLPGLLTWVLLGNQKLWHRLGLSFILALSFWSIVITYSRGAWIGIFFGVTFLIFTMISPNKRRNIYLSLGLLWATIILFIAFIMILANSSGQEFFSRYQTIHWRLNLWGDCMVMIKDKLLFGHGINTFMVLFQTYRKSSFMDPSYAHNCYIQLAAETGFVGLICFIWIIVKLFHQLIGTIKRIFTQDRNLSVLIVGLLSGVYAFLVHCFFDTHLYSLQLSVYLWFMVGVLVAICKISDASIAQK